MREVATKFKYDFKSALEPSPNHPKTFLHYLLNQGDVVENCPPVVLQIILLHNPRSIERSFGDEVHPLTDAIQKSYYGEKEVVETMIRFMEKTKPYRVLKNKNREGEKCIEAAFEAATRRRPLRLEWVLKLVNWATEPMLMSPGSKGLNPLQRVVMYEQGFRDPKYQPKLVKALLDKCGRSLYDVVTAEKRFMIGSFDGTLTSPLSVYRWHKHTKEVFSEALNRRLAIPKRSPASQQVVASAGNRMEGGPSGNSALTLASGKVLEDSAPSHDRKTFKDGSKTGDFKDEKDSNQRSASARPKNPSEKEEQQVANADSTSGANGSGQGGSGSNPEQAQASMLKERKKEADFASDEICWELELRCLRATIETSPSAHELTAEESRTMEEDYAMEFLGTTQSERLLPLRQIYIRWQDTKTEMLHFRHLSQVGIP